jgi:peptidoglycan/xylan/chitin deacetylase (PgdA/CDA1 family)
MSAKHLVRDSVARILLFAGLTSPARRGRGQLSVATFHRVLPDEERRAYPYPGLAVTPEELDALLAYFGEHFDCGPLSMQHERFLKGAGAKLPLLALTFDDGQYDNYLHARPALARHGMKATFFIPVQAVERNEPLWHDHLGFAILALQGAPGGRERLARLLSGAGLTSEGPRSTAENVSAQSKRLPLPERLRLVEALAKAAGAPRAPAFARLMTFGELAALAAEGHEIGSHSMTHCMMPECDDRVLAYEVGESRRVLQARAGQPIDAFCYPNGDFDERSVRAVADAGYARAVTTSWGLNDGRSDRFRLLRLDMEARRALDSNGRFAPALVAFRMSGLYPGL